MRSTMRSRTGDRGVAPAVSAATTAYPSIADLANGGTSMLDVTSHATTRPAASANRTRSVLASGRIAAARRRRASSSEMVDVKGRKLSIRLPDQVAELG